MVIILKLVSRPADTTRDVSKNIEQVREVASGTVKLSETVAKQTGIISGDLTGLLVDTTLRLKEIHRKAA